MKRSLTIAGLMCLLFGCSRRDYGPLIAGYSVLAVNPTETYVADRGGQLISCPLANVGISGTYIVAHCARVGDKDDSYWVVNTADGVVISNIKHSELILLFFKIGIKEPVMNKSAFYFTGEIPNFNY